MKKDKIALWETGEYTYEKAGDFIPFCMATLHEDKEIHPAMIVAPGGIYSLLTIMEAQHVAKMFFERNYNVFVLAYTNNITLDTPVGLQPLKDISRAVRILRKSHEKYHIDPNRVAACGFSAGGHLVGNLSVNYNRADLETNDDYIGISNRLDAAILNYPMVMNGMSDFKNELARTLLGDNPSDAELNAIRLDKHVTKDTPPLFITHGRADWAVKPEHSMMLATACLEHGVNFELHLFDQTDHGYAGAEVQSQEILDSVYVFDQLYEYVKSASREELAQYKSLYGTLNADMSYDEFTSIVTQETMMKIYLAAFGFTSEDMPMPDDMENLSVRPAVNSWIDLADEWLKLTLKI